MIAINKSLRELDKLAFWHLDVLKNKPFMIGEKLYAAVAHAASGRKKLFEVIEKYWPELVTARPARLEEINKDINTEYKAVIANVKLLVPPKDLKAALKQLRSEITQVFDYSYFISANESEYAYELARKLDVSVCLYCNRHFTHTIYTRTGKTRPQFDHFLKKSSFPWLGLSFYNLVPSCYVCNSSFKGSKMFSVKTHLHPFFEGMVGLLEFKTGVESANYTTAHEEDFTIELKPVPRALKKNVIRAKRNAQVFHLENLYNRHKDHAAEIIKKTQWYTKKRLEHMETEVGEGKLFSSKEEIMRIALGNYLTPNNLGKRVLAKLTRDIASEFGWLKYISDKEDR